MDNMDRSLKDILNSTFTLHNSASTHNSAREPVGFNIGNEMNANDKQIGGQHYQLSIQPWDYIIANNIGYLEGNVIKYVSRWQDKGGVDDLRKARHYLDKLIEVSEPSCSSLNEADLSDTERSNRKAGVK